MIICSHCNKEYKNKASLNYHLWSLTHKEQIKENGKRWVSILKNREKRDKYLEKRFEKNKKEALDWQHTYYKNNKEECNKKMQIWYQKNKKEHIDKCLKYQKTFKGKLVQKASNHNRRVKKNKFSKLTSDKIIEVYFRNIKEYGILTCYLCFKIIKKNKYALDHSTPICRAEEFPNLDLNSIENLGVAHKSCNSKKAHLTLEEWFCKYLEIK